MSVEQSETYMPVSIAEGIRSAAAHTPEKIALSENERSLDYRSLVDRINRVSNGIIHDLGLEKGEHIALMSGNCLEFIEIVCGAGDAGVATAMINPRLTKNEAAYICNDSRARVLFVHELQKEVLEISALETIERIIVIGGDYEIWLQEQENTKTEVHISEKDIFSIPYTAGTTGNPKGVLLPHRSRVLTFFSMAVEYGCYSSEDRALAIAPLFHGAGFAFALAPVFFGGYCEILSKFEPETVLKKLAENDITNTFMVPTHFNAIFALGESTLSQYQFPSLRTLISNAAPLPQSSKEKIVGYFGQGILFECYGSTEGAIANLRPADQLRKTKCVGKPFPCTQVRLLDENGKEVERGEIGELYSRSPFLFSGYWGKDEATKNSLRRGWFSAGDMAMQDDEGYLYIVDRKNDMIISGGVNIYPRDIEEVLHSHEDIIEAAVVGVPDDYWGEKILAVIVCKDEMILNDEKLDEYCRQHLADYKVPKEYKEIEQLPRNAAGKVLRRELKLRYQ